MICINRKERNGEETETQRQKEPSGRDTDTSTKRKQRREKDTDRQGQGTDKPKKRGNIVNTERQTDSVRKTNGEQTERNFSERNGTDRGS